jgi:hypothetical protein
MPTLFIHRDRTLLHAAGVADLLQSPCGGGDPDISGPGTTQHARAFRRCCASSQDVIHQQDVAAAYPI